jgi:hypothetical protein
MFCFVFVFSPKKRKNGKKFVQNNPVHLFVALVLVVGVAIVTSIKVLVVVVKAVA